MLADIHGKIRRDGSNLTETLEDNLTGNVFGALRYLPFNDVVKPILLKSIKSKDVAFVDAVKNAIDAVDLEYWADKIQFWPNDKDPLDGKRCELDLRIDFDSCVIGIEVKYNSGMSDYCCNNEFEGSEVTGEMSCYGDASPDDSKREEEIERQEAISRDQLVRESRVLKNIVGNEDQIPILILLARGMFAKETVSKTLASGNLAKDVKLCWIEWEDLLEAIQNFLTDRKYHDNNFTRLILGDLEDLLINKGFEKFVSFACLDLDSKQPIIFTGEDSHYQFGDSEEDEDATFVSFANLDGLPIVFTGKDGHYQFGDAEEEEDETFVSFANLDGLPIIFTGKNGHYQFGDQEEEEDATFVSFANLDGLPIVFTGNDGHYQFGDANVA